MDSILPTPCLDAVLSAGAMTAKCALFVTCFGVVYWYFGWIFLPPLLFSSCNLSIGETIPLAVDKFAVEYAVNPANG